MFAIHLVARWFLMQCSCPSVYMSFMLETQTDGKWINKDWAKIGSGCVCSAGHVGRLCTDSQSVSEDEVMERGSNAGRTLMGVMLMRSEPINKLSPPLPSPHLWSPLVCLTPSQVRWGREFSCAAANRKIRLGCSGWSLLACGLEQKHFSCHWFYC